MKLSLTNFMKILQERLSTFHENSPKRQDQN